MLPPPNKQNCWDNASPEARWRSRGKLSTTWRQFSYLPRSLTSTAASENGARQCAGEYWEFTHFEERHSIISQWKRKGVCPASTHSNGHRLTWFSPGEGQCYSERPAHNGHCFFLSLHCQEAPRWMLPGMQYTETGGTRLLWNRSPNRREPGIPRAESPFANDVMEGGGQVWPSRCTTYRLWMGSEGIWARYAYHFSGSRCTIKLDVIRCSCKEEDKVCSGRCSYGSNGMSCTSYCVCEGGMLAVTHILKVRRTKATHNTVKWIMINLRGKRVIDWAHDRRY